ncbi:bifunctional N(6)-L-threonylcarbamoyladenine synthase/serine/threonine protein kinase [archaeon]|nr:bifunctional N(6)-L-threonylcarbamoyladenine synthase/serine/threonine protein kinase [archaeon]
MYSLGIEGTAHTVSVGIVDENCNVLANQSANYFPKEGIHPRKAVEHHAEAIPKLITTALKEAKLTIKDIDVISFSKGPGIQPCLRLTATIARTIAINHKKPIIGVNHCIAHVEIGKKKTGAKDPIILYVSGGNTQVIGFAQNRYRVFGETIDIAIGNSIDKFARFCDLGFPGGPIVEKLAKKGKFQELPYKVKGMDFSFSGIAVELERRYKKGANINDLCYSFQETVFAMLTESVERALAHTEKTEVLLTGGVAQNKRLQQMLKIMAKERGCKYFAVPKEYAGDNGAMIAWAGMIKHKNKKHDQLKDTKIIRDWRIDEVIL